MKVIDSSGWLEILTDGKWAETFLELVATPNELRTPSVVVYEVYRWMKRVRGEEEAIRTVAVMEQSEIVLLTSVLAMEAADLGLKHRLAMADSIVYATALAVGAEVCTCDEDFQGLPGVRYYPKK